MTWREVLKRLERESGLMVYRKGTGAAVDKVRWCNRGGGPSNSSSVP